VAGRPALIGILMWAACSACAMSRRAVERLAADPGFAVIGMVFAFPFAILLALGRRSQLPAVRMVSVAYIELVRGVPLITVLFMASVMFAAVPAGRFHVDKLLRAQTAFILFAAAYLAEVVRGGLQAIPKGQIEAADALASAIGGAPG